MAILGIDEVGRGPWAGPLVVGAVILPEEKEDWVFELRDSKKLSERRREELNYQILEGAIATGLGWVWHYEIDEIGLNEALNLATKRAIRDMKKHFPGTQFSEIIIDGDQNFLEGTALEKWVTTLVKGDDLIKEVSAASIIAKVARDEYMIELAEEYPDYGFEKNKGYGTKQHIEAIEDYGVTPEHRMIVRRVQKILGIQDATNKKRGGRNQRNKNTTAVGQKAEQKVADFLASEGHEIVARNYKNKISEIDIISLKDDELYFTEVRYRKDDQRGGGIGSIDARKRRQMKFAAQVFLANRPEFQLFQPLLAVGDVIGENFEIRDWLVLDE